MNETNSESEIIETLNATLTVRGFFIAAVEVITESIDSLIQRIFRKDEAAVQEAVKPLLNKSGPLGELSDRLKLLFGIGVLPADIYHDVEDIIKLKNKLNQDGKEYFFTDAEVINSLKSLRLVSKTGLVPLELIEADKKVSDEFYQIQQQRQQQVIKSGLSLAIVDICIQLDEFHPV